MPSRCNGEKTRSHLLARKLKSFSGFQLTAQGRARNLPVYCFAATNSSLEHAMAVLSPCQRILPFFDVILSD